MADMEPKCLRSFTFSQGEKASIVKTRAHPTLEGPIMTCTTIVETIKGQKTVLLLEACSYYAAYYGTDFSTIVLRCEYATVSTVLRA